MRVVDPGPEPAPKTGGGQKLTGALYGLARLCIRHRFVALGAWLVMTVALVAVSLTVGDNTNDNLSLPGTDSQRATDTLKKSFPAQANDTSPIVLHASGGKLTDSKYSGAGALSTSTTARRAYDLMSKYFGPGSNGPLLLAVSLKSPAKAPPGSSSRRAQKLEPRGVVALGLAATRPTGSGRSLGIC